MIRTKRVTVQGRFQKKIAPIVWEGGGLRWPAKVVYEAFHHVKIYPMFSMDYSSEPLQKSVHKNVLTPPLWVTAYRCRYERGFCKWANWDHLEWRWQVYPVALLGSVVEACDLTHGCSWYTAYSHAPLGEMGDFLPDGLPYATTHKLALVKSCILSHHTKVSKIL